MENRKHPRYKIAGSVDVVISTSLGETKGSLLDVSAEGAQCVLSRIRSNRYFVEGDAATVTIEKDGKKHQCSCKVVRASKNRLSIRLNEPLTEEMLSAVVDSRWGYVEWKEGRAVVHGHVTSAIAKDLMQSARVGKVIDFSNVKTISNTAYGTVLAIKLRGGKIEGMNEKFIPLLTEASASWGNGTQFV
jgi:hypothetical protein